MNPEAKDILSKATGRYGKQLYWHIRRLVESQIQRKLMSRKNRNNAPDGKRSPKLRELEREAKHQSLVDEMQAIVDEMVTNREERLWQRFLSLIDSRKDDNPDDEWLVLKGAWEENAYIGYAPVTNVEYAAYKTDFSYPSGEERYPAQGREYEHQPHRAGPHQCGRLCLIKGQLRRHRLLGELLGVDILADGRREISHQGRRLGFQPR